MKVPNWRECVWELEHLRVFETKEHFQRDLVGLWKIFVMRVEQLALTFFQVPNSVVVTVVVFELVQVCH